MNPLDQAVFAKQPLTADSEEESKREEVAAPSLDAAVLPKAPTKPQPVLPKKPIPAPVEEVTMRDFDDVDGQRQAVFDRVQKAYAGKSLEGKTHTLRFADVDYRSPKAFTKADETKAVRGRKRLYWALQGRMELVDNETGEVVSRDEKPRTLAHVPYLTSMGAFVQNGTKYMVSNQQRLKPGAYSRVKDNGEIETQFNVMPGTGRAFRVNMTPSTGVFRMQVGQSSTKLYPILKDLGIGDKELEEAWGPDILNANRLADDRGDRVSLDKIVRKLARKSDLTDNDLRTKRKALLDSLARMKLDPDVMRRTMGKAHESAGPQAIMDAAAKILRIHQGQDTPDERDSLMYQKFLSAEDFFGEHVDKDAGSLMRQALFKAQYHKDVSKIPDNPFTKQIASVLLSSGLAAPMQEINPIEILDARHKIIRLGEGGIGSTQAVSRDARNIHPTHFGFIDAIRAPESAKIGLDMRVASGVRKGSDGKLYQEVNDLRLGKKRYISADQFFDAPVAFPGEMERPGRKVRAMQGGKIRYVPRDQVAYELGGMDRMHTPGTNFVPMYSSAKGQRLLMGARMGSQALPLENPDSPLVRNAFGDSSYHDHYGKAMGAVRSDAGGKVVKVTDDEIVVRQPDGEKRTYGLYNNHSMNQKTNLHNTATVQVGDKIKPGQLLARSNFTDAQGSLATGRNASVIYHMMEGMTHEDAVVMSASAAQEKFKSEQLYSTRLEKDDRVSNISKSAYQSRFGSNFDKKQLDKIDDNGVAIVGQVVNPGDPLILALGQFSKRIPGSQNRVVKSQISDAAKTWDHEHPGVVTSATKTSKGWNVEVKSFTPTRVGDKLANNYGGKGVIAKIVPDDQMPVGPDGNPVDIALNPFGVNSRTNPAQIAETMLSRIAEKTGKPYILPPNMEGSIAEFAWNELKKHGMLNTLPDGTQAATSTIHDPRTGRDIHDVMYGKQHFFKLHHLAESKLNARSEGSYTLDEAPAKGGKEGAKRIGFLESLGLLSHGATEVLKDAKLTRGQRNGDFWQIYRKGMTPPAPRISKAYAKFEALLQGAGVSLRKRGTKTQVLPMMDSEVEELAGSREITTPGTIDFNTMEPIKGGLFDVGLTGGNDGTKWSYIKLKEPMPNPIMEDPIKLLLGVNGRQFQEVLQGEYKLPAGSTGGTGMAQALQRLDIDKEIEKTKTIIGEGRKTKRDKAVKRLGVLETLRRNNMKPADLMMTKVPVLPPKFRPVSKMDKTQLVADANLLYNDLLEANENVALYKDTFGKGDAASLDLYNSFKAVTGLGNPVSVENQERGAKGLLKQVFGDSPKNGVFQRKVLGQSVDQVGRGVITPDPDLDVDEVGLPIEAGWKLYKNYVIRDMVQKGMPPSQAFESWMKRDKQATDALYRAVETRPVVINRAPSLHKFNITGHKPKLVPGNALRMPIAVLAGHGADFDGDALNFHVPHGDKAVEEVYEKMLPSKMLRDPKSFDVHMLPSQGYVSGLYLASTSKSDKLPKAFASREEMVRAYKRGEIDAGDEVVIVGEQRA